MAKKSGNTNKSDPLTRVNEEKIAAKQRKMAQLKTILVDNPKATNTELADLLDVSRATVRNYKQELNGSVS